MKLHWCCGQTYLKDYINIDIQGHVIGEWNGRTFARKVYTDNEGKNQHDVIWLDNGNPNETILDKYFKFPFDPNPITRQANKRPFIVDRIENILEKWNYEDNSIDELILVSCIEHFNPITELPHVLKEINRTMKPGGKLIISFPDIKAQIEKYYETDPLFCMELLYCNHKDIYSIHHYGFTEKSWPLFLGNNWKYKQIQIINYDYPMIQLECIKNEL